MIAFLLLIFLVPNPTVIFGSENGSSDETLSSKSSGSDEMLSLKELLLKGKKEVLKKARKDKLPAKKKAALAKRKELEAEIKQAIRDGNIITMQSVLDQGFDLEQPLSDGMLVLTYMLSHFPAKAEEPHCYKTGLALLLDQRAPDYCETIAVKKNKLQSAGTTFLQHAIFLDDQLAAEVLIDYVDIDNPGLIGKTPLFLALEKEKMTRGLLEQCQEKLNAQADAECEIKVIHKALIVPLLYKKYKNKKQKKKNKAVCTPKKEEETMSYLLSNAQKRIPDIYLRPRRTIDVSRAMLSVYDSFADHPLVKSLHNTNLRTLKGIWCLRKKIEDMQIEKVGQSKDSAPNDQICLAVLPNEVWCDIANVVVPHCKNVLPK